MKKPSERRSSLRRPIHHEAMLQTADGASLTCIIADFCLDGMFIKFIGTNLSRSLQIPALQEEHSTVSLVFTGDKGQALEVQAEIMHAMEGACGLRFLKRYDKAVQSLISVSNRAGLSVQHTVPIQQIIEQCKQCIHQEFGALLDDYWPALINKLKADAVEAGTDQTANMLMALAEKVAQQQATLHQSILEAVEDPVAAFHEHLEKRKSMSDKLALIDKEEFEDWLLARVLIVKSEADYQNLLLPLKLRLDAISIGDKRHHQSVFGPALLVSAFHTGVHALLVNSATEKRLFQQFEKSVMSHLTRLYEALNEVLISHQILPKLSLKEGLLVKNLHATERKPKPASGGQIAAEQGSQKGPEDKASTPVSSANSTRQSAIPAHFAASSSRTYMAPPFSRDLHEASPFKQRDTDNHGFQQNQEQAKAAISNITHLLRRLRPETEAPTSEDNAEAAYSNAEITQGLADLQVANLASIPLERSLSLMERVREKLQLEADKSINNQHKTAIDVVDRFFLSMRDNPRISDDAKQFLLKLDVPILKVLLKDESFFENRQSSVRAVINRIAQLGAKDAKLHPASKARIETLVNQLVAEFDQDTTVFDQALSELDELLDKQNHIYVKNVERVAAAAEGAFKVEEATLAVAEAVNQRIANKYVPTAVITLLNDGWKEYLQLTHIKQGGDSVAWQEGLSVLDRLIAFGEDPRIPIDIKVMLPKIQEGLKLVSGTNEASAQVRDALKAFILNAPKGLHLSEQAQTLSLPETEEDLLKRNISKSQELKDWILQVKTLVLGSWFKFTKNSKNTSYIRLVWVAKGYSKFVFVNHQGMRVVELGLFKLAEYFKDGLIRPEPDYELPIFNQGLDDMVKDVYERLAYESSHDSITGLIKKAEFCRQVRMLMKQGKRTAPCSLLMLRFRDPGHAAVQLSETLSKEVVKALHGLSYKQIVLGRVSETDFVLFSGHADASSFRAACQETLMHLCRTTEFVAHELLVAIGESRAHFGFNNPESMIRHAAEALDSTVGSRQCDLKSTSSEQGAESADDHQDDTETQVVLINEAANSDQNVPDPDSLDFGVFSQNVAALVNAGGTRETARNSRLEQNAQINLLYMLAADAHPYFPESEAAANALDDWWLRQLESLQARDKELLESYPCLRVSLSAFALNSQERVEQLLALANDGRLNAARIVFDIYDSYQIADVDLAVLRMNTLKQSGYRFCLEHFGTERCPFAYLKALPADMIKIDDSFIAQLNAASIDQADSAGSVEPDGNSKKGEDALEASADSIVEIAHYMGKQVIASSVDSAVCLQKMKHLNVDFVQGSTVSQLQKFEL